MCKKCELSGIVMELQALNIEEVKKTITLPDSWVELIKNGFHEDLVDRAYAYMGWISKRNVPREIKNARAVLSSLGKGFLSLFKKETFPLKKDDQYYELKVNALNSIEELSILFGNRVSSTVWNSFAHLAVREDPEKRKVFLVNKTCSPTITA